MHWVAYVGVAILSAGIGYLSTLINWRKSKYDIHESEARTSLASAQTRQIDLQVSLSATDMVLRALDRAALAQAKQDELREKCEQLLLENALLAEQNRRMAAILRAHGVQFDLQEGK